MPNTRHAHVANVLWSAKPVSKVNKTPVKSTLSAAYQEAFLFWLGSFFLYTVFEGKFYIWKTKWTLGRQLMVHITFLLDMHPPHFPTGQQGLWVFNISPDPQGSGTAKKLTNLCYPELWPSKGGQQWGRISLSCSFPDPPDKFITLILKTGNLTLLSNTKFTPCPFWIEGRL